MKYLFLLCLVLLLAATAVTARFAPAGPGKTPIIYWLTDDNPARDAQVAAFDVWLKRVHPGVDCKLIVDSANDDPSKSEIQAVSGVADDVMDKSGADLRFFHAMGAILDLGRVDDLHSLARSQGFGPDKTYPAVIPEISVPEADGAWHQFSFPCNVDAPMMFLNRTTFKKYGLSPPPMVWTLDDFEKLGLELDQRANAGQPHRRVFIAAGLSMGVLRRTLGGNSFNETDTRCILDAPANIQAEQYELKFTNVDHILPDSSEINAQATESGYGGAGAQLFNKDEYGMIWIGRYLTIVFRQFDATRKATGRPLLDLGVSELPNGGFRTTTLGSRSAAVYVAGKHSNDLALYFLQFLTSPEYNQQIVNDADALPPNPAFVNDPEYVHPADHPNEWGIHKAFADAALNLAIASSYSPFVLDNSFELVDREMQDLCMNGLLSPEEAGRLGAQRVNDEIQRSLSEDPSLKPWYDRLIDQQNQIEACRAVGKKVPLDWITDPFWKRYYVHMGWSDPQ